MLSQKPRKGFSFFFNFFLNKALFLKILTKTCQKSDFLAKIDFFLHNSQFTLLGSLVMIHEASYFQP